MSNNALGLPWLATYQQSPMRSGAYDTVAEPGVDPEVAASADEREAHGDRNAGASPLTALEQD